jgi:hypothetical protein
MLATLWLVMFLNLAFPAYGPAVINPAMAKALAFRARLGSIFSVYAASGRGPGGDERQSFRRAQDAAGALTIVGALLMTCGHERIGAMCHGFVGGRRRRGPWLRRQDSRWFVRRRSLALSVMYR